MFLRLLCARCSTHISLMVGLGRVAFTLRCWRAESYAQFLKANPTRPLVARLFILYGRYASSALIGLKVGTTLTPIALITGGAHPR